jgi:ribA/ribD-fused uncharacterized protein
MSLKDEQSTSIASKLAKLKALSNIPIAVKIQKQKRKNDEVDPISPDKDLSAKDKKFKENVTVFCPELQGEINELDSESQSEGSIDSDILQTVTVPTIIEPLQQIETLVNSGANAIMAGKESQGEIDNPLLALNVYTTLMEKLLTPLQTQMTQFLNIQATMHKDITDARVELKGTTTEVQFLKENIHTSEQRLSEQIGSVTDKTYHTESRVADLEKSLVDIRLISDNAKKEAAESLSQVNSVKAQLSIANSQIKKLSEKQLQDEVRSRQNNLRFLGINEDKSRESQIISEKKLRKVLKEDFGLETADSITITRAHRTGPANTKYPRVIIACFANFQDKMAVWKARFAVKNSDIRVQEDYPAEILARRKILMPSLHAIRKSNESAQESDKIDVALVVDKLFVDGRMFSTQNIHQILSPFKPEEIATRDIDGTIYFFTAASPYSNHHKCSFQVLGVNYNCMEQFMFATKAKEAQDRNSYDKIMCSTDPVEQKKLGADIVGIEDRDWQSKAFDLMKSGMYAKFYQNSYLKSRLLSTENKWLSESNLYDCWWGNGMDLSDPELGKKKPRGQNRLGELLVFIRAELKKPVSNYAEL